MNIFFLSWHPKQAAQHHCDKHVVKMLLESTQLLWTAQHILTGGAPPPDDAPTTKSGSRGYRPTHAKHPCARWVRVSADNYRWLCALATALAAEYHYRYPSAPRHACEDHVDWLSAHVPPSLASKGLTWPAQAMPPEYRSLRKPVAAYRAFYQQSKGAERGILTYTRRPPPDYLNTVARYREPEWTMQQN